MQIHVIYTESKIILRNQRRKSDSCTLTRWNYTCQKDPKSPFQSLREFIENKASLQRPNEKMTRGPKPNNPTKGGTQMAGV